MRSWKVKFNFILYSTVVLVVLAPSSYSGCAGPGHRFYEKQRYSIELTVHYFSECREKNTIKLRIITVNSTVYFQEYV